MKKILTILSCSVLLVACGKQEPQSQANPSTSVFVIWENGGTIQPDKQEQSQVTAFHLLQSLGELERHKSSRNTTINIIETARPNRIAWSGNPASLLSEAEDVKKIFSFKQSFSDITLSYRLVNETITITQPDEVWLYQIGQFIDARFTTDNKPIEIQLPQPISTELALPNFLDRLRVYKLYLVHPDQATELSTYFSSRSVLDRSRKGLLDFRLMGEAQTRAHLSDLL